MKSFRRFSFWLLLLFAAAFGYGQTETSPAGKPTTRNYRSWPSASSAETTDCTDSRIPDFRSFARDEVGYAPRWCKLETFNIYTPGFSFGNVAGLKGAAGFPQGWQLTQFRQFTSNIYSQGIKGENRVYNVFAPGDFNLNDEVHAAAGLTAASDEGVELHRNTVVQVQEDVLGSVTSADRPIGPATIATKCTGGCGTQGSGRYLIESNPVASGYATRISAPKGYVPGVIELGDALSGILPSTAWGTLTSACIVPQTAANTGGPCTFTVSVASGMFLTGSMVADSGTFHNQAKITMAAAPSNGLQTITLTAHHSIPVGAMLYQGQPAGDTRTSCTGLAIELVANTVHSVKFPFDVAGCKDLRHLEVAQFLRGLVDFDPANVYTQQAGVSAPITADADGILTLRLAAAAIPPLVGQTVTITGSANFSGSCANSVAANRNGLVLQCRQPGKTNRADPSATDVKVTLGTTGYGNTQLRLYRMAEVLDVRNPASGEVDGTYILEPNQMHLAAGTGVELTQHVAQSYSLNTEAMVLLTPYFAEQGSAHRVNLRNVFGNGVGQVNGFSLNADTNETPLDLYAGFGGTRSAPPHDNLHGLWAYRTQMDVAPQYGLDYIGCPATRLGCADSGQSYIPLQLAGDAGGLKEVWTPFRNEFELQITGPGADNDIHFSAHGIYTQRPIATSRLQQSEPNQMGGTCTMHGGTSCTITLAAAYEHTPICNVSAQGTNLSGGVSACSVAGRTITVTAANPNSNTWGVILLGNPD